MRRPIESNRNNSIYALPNKAGYRYNINHPKINELYMRFKKWKGVAQNVPLSDGQREEFEKYVDQLIPPGKG